MHNIPTPSLDSAFAPASNGIDFDVVPVSSVQPEQASRPAGGPPPGSQDLDEQEFDESLPPPSLLKDLDPGASLYLDQWLAHRYAELRLFAAGVRSTAGPGAVGTAAEFDAEFAEFCRTLAQEMRA